MFSIKTNLNRRSNRYNIYQPQRYALYVMGKWMGLIGSALLLFSLTIKWYFLLDDNTKSWQNVLTWCLIIGSILFFMIGALAILGLHWYVEKKYNNNVQTTSEELEKTQKHLREEHRNQSKRFKQQKTNWLKWNSKKNLRLSLRENDNQSSTANSIKPNSTTIYNTNATESSFQVISNDSYLSDTASNNTTSTSFSSTKKLVRTNSKFNQPTLPIIDETKQQSANDDYQSSTITATTSSLPTSGNQMMAYALDVSGQQADIVFDINSIPVSLESKAPNKTKHAHKLSTGSGKNYILEAFLKNQDLNENTKLSDHMMNSQSANQTNSSIKNSQLINQPGNQSSISSQNTNGTLNPNLDLTE